MLRIHFNQAGVAEEGGFLQTGNNSELMEKCQTLREYCEYVACVRAHAEEESIEDAVDHAVTECIQKGILADFLTAQRAEVKAMSIFEYNEEEEKRKLRDAERAEGREEGREEGRAEGISESVLVLLEDIGAVSGELRERIMMEHDKALLRKWLKLAAKSESLEEFMKYIAEESISK